MTTGRSWRSGLFAALQHEGLLLWRQPGVLAVYAVLALVLGPVGLVGMQAWVGAADRAAGSVAEGRVLPISADATVSTWIREGDGLEVVDGPVSTDREIEGTESYAHARIDGKKVILERALSVLPAGKVEERFQKVLRRENADRRAAELARVGVDPEDFAIEVEVVERSASSKQGDVAGRVLPGTLVFLLIVVALFSAFDTLTKEKEKGTAETLLSLSLDRRVLIGAKYLAVVLTTVGVGSLWALGLFVSEAVGLLSLPDLFGEGQVFTLRTTAILLLFVVLVGSQVAAASIAVAAWAPNYRQASVASTPMMLMLLAPTGFASFQQSDLTPLFAITPMLNVATATRLWLSGELDVAMGLLTLVATTVHAGIALGASAWWLQHGDPLDRGLDAESRRGVGNFAPDAPALFALVLVCFWFLGTLAQATNVIGGIVFSQIVLFGGLAVAGVAWVGAPLRETLSLRMPAPRDLALGVVIGVTLPALGSLVAVVSSFVVPVPKDTMSNLASITEYPLPLVLLAAAVLPGICEELLFRGAMLGLLRTRTGPVLAIAVSSAMFGLVHLDIARIPITGVLGLVFGVLLVRSGSVWVGAIAHLLNNGILFTIAAVAGSAPRALGGGAWVGLLVGAAVCLFAVSRVGARRYDAAARRSDAGTG
ncbi:MAG: CPBP family glutamic-type intramembrane protease [Myxococcota bacterium]